CGGSGSHALVHEKREFLAYHRTLGMITLDAVRMRIALSVPMILLVLAGALIERTRWGSAPDVTQRHAAANEPTFYRDVLPVLQDRCQTCHRANGIAPMRFETYEQTRPYAAAIAAATQNKSMPPWFADPHIGRFSNDPSLSAEQIAALAAWAGAGAPAGGSRDAPSPIHWAESWSIPQPDLILQMPKGVAL